MRKHILFCLSFLLFVTTIANAQDSYTERVQKYIEQYRALALIEQKNSGIPASITLGQGILETEAGASELMTEANNHFGIKCKNGWDGPTFTHTDDAPDECFKKYSCAAESYKDHSLHLKRNPRYAPLFAISATDYASWAVCLKKCGYATNPQYAQRLIKIIEDFKLQQYTYSALDSTFPGGSLLASAAPMLPAKPKVAPAKKTDDSLLILWDKEEATPPMAKTPVKAPVVPAKKTDDSLLILWDEKDDNAASSTAAIALVDSAFAMPVTDTTTITGQELAAEEESVSSDTTKIETVNGLKAFYARKNEMLLGYAVKYNLRYPRLLEFNDLKDAPLPFDMYVYLEKKLTSGTHETHQVATGESLLMIAQSEGIQLKKLVALNLLYPDEEPKAGTVLQLQKQTLKRAEVQAGERAAHKQNAIVDAGSAAPVKDEGYITIDRTKPVQPAVPAAKPKTAAEASAVLVAAKPASITPPAKQAVAAVAERKEQVKQPEVKQDATSDEEFTKLKADLDKIVYADNSKLIAAKQKTPVVANKEQAAEPVKTSAKTEAKYYTIKKGETAFSIAKRNNITVDQLFEWNDIDASGIKTGTSIIVKK